MTSFGVIFDVDGVLFDSERQSLTALRLAVEQISGARFVSGPDFLTYSAGRDDDSLCAYFQQSLGLAIEPARFREIKLQCYRQAIAEDPIAIAPGAMELLDNLKADAVPYAIATGAVRAKLEISLATLGMASRFPIITTVDDVATGKPDPAIFLVSAERLGIPPARLVVFEDTLNGITAANRAGMVSVGVVGTFGRESLGDAAHVVDSLQEVSVAMLRRWVLEKE